MCTKNRREAETFLEVYNTVGKVLKTGSLPSLTYRNNIGEVDNPYESRLSKKTALPTLGLLDQHSLSSMAQRQLRNNYNIDNDDILNVATNQQRTI